MSATNLFRGEKIRFTAVRGDEFAVVASWYDDPEFGRNMSSAPTRPQTEEEVSGWLREMQKSSTVRVFGIRPLEGDELLGLAVISEINWPNSSGMVSLGPGDPNQRGKGYGRETMELLLRYAFDELNLHRVSLTVFSYNENAIRLYEQLGFQHEGTQREYGKRDGKRYDYLMYGMLQHEWQALQS